MLKTRRKQLRPRRFSPGQAARAQLLLQIAIAGLQHVGVMTDSLDAHLARLAPLAAPEGRKLGAMKGRAHCGDAFFEPLPDEFLSAFGT